MTTSKRSRDLQRASNEAVHKILLQALLLALAAALLAGLYPAWKMARTSPALALREGVRQRFESRSIAMV